VEDPEANGVHPLMAGDYEVIMGFANPNYRDPTEVFFGTVTVAGGETTEITLGAVTFNVAPALAKMPVEAVILKAAGGAGPEIRLESHNNGYYLFKPKPVPAGEYTFGIAYYRSPQAAVVASGIAVSAEQEAVVTLDAGIRLVPAEDRGVQGWDLVPAGGTEPVVVVRRGWDNQEPLWRTFAVPAGSYDLDVWLKGMDDPLRLGEGLTIAAGDLLEFDTGL